jgi:hypothetical protein
LTRQGRSAKFSADSEKFQSLWQNSERHVNRVSLPTQDPFDGGPLVVTRLVNPSSGNAFEGRFTLGWLGSLSAEQIDFVGLLLLRRNNLQKLAADLGIAYNTARTRLEEIVRALGGSVDEPVPGQRAAAGEIRDVLERLAAGEISSEDAEKLI